MAEHHRPISVWLDKLVCVLRRLIRDRDSARSVNERDRTRVADAIRGIETAIRQHEWLRLGRGSYEWNDDRWMEEFGAALDEIEKAMEPLRTMAADFDDCPVGTAAIRCARDKLPRVETLLYNIRERGWKVAHHDDVLLDGRLQTYWLFTKDGQSETGEGPTDAEALVEALAKIRTREPEPPGGL